MKGVYLPGTREAHIKEWPDPKPGSGEVLIAIKASALLPVVVVPAAGIHPPGEAIGSPLVSTNFLGTVGGWVPSGVPGPGDIGAGLSSVNTSQVGSVAMENEVVVRNNTCPFSASTNI